MDVGATKDSLFFHAVTVVTVLLFAWGVYEHVSFWFRGNLSRNRKGTFGQKVSLALGQTARALGSAATYRHILFNVILQRQIMKESFGRWFMHAAMIWGLAGLFFIGSLGDMAVDLHLASFQKDTPWFAVLNDIFGVLVLLGAAVALARRYIFGVHHLKSTLDDIVIMAGVGLGVISGLLLETARLNMDAVPAAVGAYSFAGQWLRGVLPSAWPWTGIHTAVWWVHFLLGSAMVAYLPNSKLFHVLVAPLSVGAFSLRDRERLRA